jgi:hypothetical protein
LRRLALALVATAALLAACGDDGGGESVDDERLAGVAEDLGYTCDGPAGSGDEQNRLCTDADGADALRTFVWDDSDGVDTRTAYQQDLICRGPEPAFWVWAVGENWIAEPLWDVAELTAENAEELQTEAEDLAQQVVDELGGEVQVLDRSLC